ncbi:MAG: DNA repair exonuclease [Clostridia bacterium]|nr:DNA repair exonuclease [Clostridia bacterium]
MIKIFHTGDLHLDSAFHRFSYPKRAAARERQREVFRKMMRYVSENGFDMVLICGDLFDTKNISPETEECVIEELSSLNCPVVIAPGNHDAYSGVALYFDGRLPENVSVFNSEEMQVFTFEELGVQVCGYAFTSDSYFTCPLDGFELPPFDGVSVLCAHTELGAPMSRYAPILVSDIERCGFDYAALGHIHKEMSPVTAGKSTVAYCGFPDSRGFDEEGVGGALSVNVEGGEVSVEKIPFGETLYLSETLDISSSADNRALVGQIEKYIASRNFGRNTALRLTLVGETDFSFSPDMNMVRTLLSQRFIYAEAEDKTLPRIDTEALENDYTLRGEIYKVLRPALECADTERRRIAVGALRAALLAIEGREIK